MSDLYQQGYRGFVSIEPHMSKSAHLPDMEGDADLSWNSYYEYGSRMNKMLEEICRI